MINMVLDDVKELLGCVDNLDQALDIVTDTHGFRGLCYLLDDCLSNLDADANRDIAEKCYDRIQAFKF